MDAFSCAYRRDVGVFQVMMAGKTMLTNVMSAGKPMLADVMTVLTDEMTAGKGAARVRGAGGHGAPVPRWTLL